MFYGLYIHVQSIFKAFSLSLSPTPKFSSTFSLKLNPTFYIFRAKEQKKDLGKLLQIGLMIPGSGLKTAIYKAWDFTTSEGFLDGAINITITQIQNKES